MSPPHNGSGLYAINKKNTKSFKDFSNIREFSFSHYLYPF
jgi:hypothetical protein